MLTAEVRALLGGEAMAEQEEKGPVEKPVDWLSGVWASFERMRRRYGLPAAALLVLSVTGGLIWWNWEDIAKRPGVARLFDWVNERPLPKATAGHLSIAVTHLAHDDKDREHEDLLLDELQHFEVEGVEVLPLDRTVDPEEPDRKKLEAEARGLLRKTGADVLIWGSVIPLSGKSAMRLNWTPARELSGAKASGKYQAQTETIALPPEFWSDLKQILGLLTQSRLTELTFDQPGRYVADKLDPLIKQVRALVQKKEGVWDAETLAGVQFSLASALELFGEQTGKNDPLAESIAVYRKVLDEWKRERAPLQWARTQTYLGIALVMLGDRESGTGRLEDAVAAYREALKERTRERVPLDWAMTQTYLGIALFRLGERENDTGKLQEAIKALREALAERTRELVPLDWAKTQLNLGGALTALGYRESGTETLEEAVAAYREALKEFTRERTPLDWALTQNNLGNALRVIGERDRSTVRLEEAVFAIREALT
jgi:tetratricopeptide (TPR) repeat protein